jgi:hypothetical protein
MGDSNEFYQLFYTHIDNSIANFINRDNNLRNITVYEDKQQHILMSLFSQQNHTENYLINMIGNHLDIYLNMIHFIKEKDRPFMPVLIDFTQMNYVFNRFFYHYAKLCMNNECIYSQTIHNRLINLQNPQH